MKAINCDCYLYGKKRCIAPQKLGNSEDSIICIVPEDTEICPAKRYFLDNISEKTDGTITLYQYLRRHGH